MKHKKFRILLLSLIMAATKLSANSLLFRNIQIPDGNVILCIDQDENGLIWMGTRQQGLFCYDGYNSYPRLAPPSLGSMSVHDLKVIGDSIYMGMGDGLIVYNRISHTYSHTAKGKITSVRKIFPHGKDLLIGCAQGIVSYSPATGKTKKICSQLPTIMDFTKTPNGFLVATVHGLYDVKGGNANEIPVNNNRKRVTSAILADNKEPGKYWIGAMGSLFSYHISTGKFNEINQLVKTSVKTITQDRFGRIYIGTDNGLYIKDGDRIKRYIHDYQDLHTIGNNIIWQTFIDHNNNLWLGTDMGLSFSGSNPFFKYQSIYQMTGISTGNYLECIYKDKHHRLWLGGSSGLILYPQSHNWSWFRQGDNRFFIGHNRIRAFYEDYEKNIWIATDNGFHKYNEKNNNLQHVVLYDKKTMKAARWIYDIAEDNQNRLWVATYNGLFIIDKKKIESGKIDIPADKVLMTDIHFSQADISRKGLVWLRTSKGLMIINTKTLKPEVIDTSHIEAMVMTPKGEIWSAAYDNFTHYDSDGRQLKKLVYDGKEHIVAMNLIDNNLWIQHAHECRIIKTNYKIDVFKIPEIVATTAFYAQDEDIYYIGGNDAMLSVKPRQLISVKRPNNLNVTEILVNGRQLFNQPEHLSQGDVSLKHNENNITVMFSDLPFFNHYQNLYLYRLKGIDRTWRKLNTDTYEASYDGLPHGNYKLEVCTMDGYGKAGNIVYTLNISILPPWYLTWWMKAIYLLLFIAICYILFNAYMVKRRLKEEQQAKARIINEAQNRILYHQNLYGDIKHSLTAIMQPLHELAGKHRDTVLRTILKETSLLNSFVRDAAEKNNSALSLPSSEHNIDIVAICRQSAEQMKKFASQHGVKVSFNSDLVRCYDEFDITEACSMFELLIGFAIQHTKPDHNVTLSLKYFSEDSRIEICIGGKGMIINPSIRPYLFQRYALQATSDNDNYTSSLYLTREYAERRQGNIQVSQNEEGCMFIVRFPVEEQNVETQHTKEKKAALLLSQNTDSENDKVITHTEKELSTAITTNENDERFLRQVINIIGENIGDSEFNVSKLLEIMGVGDKMLYRKVKQMTGLTPVEYIRDIRMKRAAILLKDGQFSVSEVMYMVGFSNSGYFSKCFNRTFGMTPTQYIQKNIKL